MVKKEIKHKIKSLRKIITEKNMVVCPYCKTVLSINDENFKVFFHSKKLYCPKCNHILDLWNILIRQLNPIFVAFGWHYSLLGCEHRILRIKLTPHEVYDLDLSKEIGEGELLYINYTPLEGGLFPIQLHSNTPMNDIKTKHIRLIPYPLEDNPKETEVFISYWFAPKEIKEDLSSMLMLDAFQRFYEGDFRHMVVSAQTSIEILQYKFFEGLLKEKVKLNLGDRERREKFLEEKATFSYQTFILLPLLGKLANFPLPDKRIFNGLKILTTVRNDVLHRGESKKLLKKEEMRDALASAFFMFKYYKIIHGIK